MLYVPYNFVKGNDHGSGWVAFANTPKPKTVDEIKKIVNDIKLDTGVDSVIPLSFQEL